MIKRSRPQRPQGPGSFDDNLLRDSFLSILVHRLRLESEIRGFYHRKLVALGVARPGLGGHSSERGGLRSFGIEHGGIVVVMSVAVVLRRVRRSICPVAEVQKRGVLARKSGVLGLGSVLRSFQPRNLWLRTSDRSLRNDPRILQSKVRVAGEQGTLSLRKSTWKLQRIAEGAPFRPEGRLRNLGPPPERRGQGVKGHWLRGGLIDRRGGPLG